MTTTRTKDITQGVRRLFAMALLLFGFPVALAVLGGSPIPKRLPPAQVVFHALGTGALADWPWAKLVAGAGWVTWALFTAAVVVELGARLRKRPARRIRGIGRVQMWVAESVTAITVLVGGVQAANAVPLRQAAPSALSWQQLRAAPAPGSSSAVIVTTAVPDRATTAGGHEEVGGNGRATPGRDADDVSRGVHQVAAGPVVGAHRAAIGSTPQEAVTGTGAQTASAAPTVTVVKGDNLWNLGATHLPPHGVRGSMRAREIWDLNKGRALTDSDGRIRVFDNPGLIFPGEVLLMPADATGVQPATAVAPPVDTVPVATPADPSPPAVSAPSANQPQGNVGPAATVPAATVPAAPAATTVVPQVPATSVPGGSRAAAVNGRSGLLPIVPLAPAGGSRSPARLARVGGAGRSTSPAPVGPMVGLGGIAAAGVIWMLGRRRREQTLRRETGRDVSAPPAAIQEVERQAREIADEEALRWVDLGLRYLGGLFAEMDEPPAVVLVRAGSVGLEVMIAPPSHDAPGRFQAIDEGNVWALDPAVELAELEVLAADRWPLLPALVTVGETAAGTVLANLEHAGSLAIEGDPERQRGLLLQILVELTSQPWADQTLSGVHVLGDAGLDTNLAGVDVDDDPMYLAQVVDKLSDRYQRDIGSATSVAARRAIDCGWEPHVAVAFPDAPPDALRCVVEAAVADRSGVAVVTAGSVPDARWRLRVDGDGSATLWALQGDRPFPMEMRVDPDTEMMTMLAADLAFAAVPADSARVVGLRDALPDVAAFRQGAREIAVMGELDVVGGAGGETVASSRRRPGLAVLAYLATHKNPVASRELEAALWPLDAAKPKFGGVAPSTLANVISNARNLLGRGPNGEELLIFTPGQGYSLVTGPELASVDWARFQKLVAVAEGENASTRFGTWAAALQIVRGHPFEGFTDGKFFAWVGAERVAERITGRVVDVAQALATAALENEDWDSVKWAVEKGRMLDPAREELFQVLMHAEGRSGKPDRVHEVYGELCAMLQKEIDALQLPSDKSEEIWKSYTADSGGRP